MPDAGARAAKVDTPGLTKATSLEADTYYPVPWERFAPKKIQDNKVTTWAAFAHARSTS